LARQLRRRLPSASPSAAPAPVQDVFAMKIMKKSELLKKNQEAHVRAER
jgi:hypothetical protein